MELKDTVEEMLSDDYIQRFKAEYNQTKIRYNKLQKLVVKYEAGTLGFEPKCPIEILKDQKMYMGCYLFKMEVSASSPMVRLQMFISSSLLPASQRTSVAERRRISPHLS